MLSGPSSGDGAGRGASSAGPGTGRPAAAAAGSGSTVPEKSASGTSPPPGETRTTGWYRSTHTHTQGLVTLQKLLFGGLFIYVPASGEQLSQGDDTVFPPFLLSPAELVRPSFSQPPV